MTDTLRDLLARVEAATGPDRELDCDLHVTLHGWRLANIGPDCDGENESLVYTPDGRPIEGFSYPLRGKIDPHYHVPNVRYTKSVDAALSLIESVLPGWEWSTSNHRHAYVSNEAQSVAYYADGVTPTLALLSALLRALIAQEHAND